MEGPGLVGFDEKGTQLREQGCWAEQGVKGIAAVNVIFLFASQDDGTFVNFELSGNRSSASLETGMALRWLGNYGY